MGSDEDQAKCARLTFCGESVLYWDPSSDVRFVFRWIPVDLKTTHKDYNIDEIVDPNDKLMFRSQNVHVRLGTSIFVSRIDESQN